MEEIDDFSFQLVSDFLGYISTRDKTNINQSVLVRGSQNVYRKNSGTIANRFGLKRRGIADGTLAGIKSSFEWNSSLGSIRPLRVIGETSDGDDARLQVGWSGTGTPLWYDLLATGSSLTVAGSYTRFVFDTWYESLEAKDRLVMARGSNDILHWSGGICQVGSVTPTTITKADDSKTWRQEGFATNLAAEKKLQINDVEYTYTGGEDTSTLTGVTPDPSSALSPTVAGSYSEANRTASRSLPTFGNAYTNSGQTFTPANNFLLSSAVFYLNAHGSPTGTAVAKIYATIDSDGSILPTGSALATSETFDVTVLTSSFSLKSFNFTGGNQINLNAGVTYAAVLQYTDGSVSNSVQMGIDTVNMTHDGNGVESLDSGVTWAEGAFDLCFYVYGVATTPAIQSVMVQSGIDPTDPISNYNLDFLKTIANQVVIGSYSSRTLYLSSDETISSTLGMTNFTDSGSSHVPGDPDFAVIDSPPTGMAIKKGELWVSSISDWYLISPNSAVPVSYGTPAVFVITKVEKKSGSARSGALAHEFIDTQGDDVVYLAQDHQLRTISSFNNLFSIKYPSLSQDVRDEFNQEDFTGGHLRAIEDFVYVTAPIAGRHYMYQTIERIDDTGTLNVKRVWQPPQIAGISRFAVLDGLVHGHSNANPQVYQVWDTNQWHDDSPSGDSLSYTSVMRLGYGHLIEKNKQARRQGMATFNKAYYEGYIDFGSTVYSNIYFDYQGSTNIENLVINSIENPPIFFRGNSEISLGLVSLGDNPLGDGLVTEPNYQALLPKFRTICDVSPTDCFEWDTEVYSVDADSRWEILALGVNAVISDSQSPFLRK